jgi:hypothetical protein
LSKTEVDKISQGLLSCRQIVIRRFPPAVIAARKTGNNFTYYQSQNAQEEEYTESKPESYCGYLPSLLPVNHQQQLFPLPYKIEGHQAEHALPPFQKDYAIVSYLTVYRQGSNAFLAGCVVARAGYDYLVFFQIYFYVSPDL